MLYLTSRIIVTLFQKLVLEQMEQNLQPQHLTSRKERIIGNIYQILRKRLYSGGAALVWGIVMYLFEVFPNALHPSLKSSMDEIYRFNPSVSVVDSRY